MRVIYIKCMNEFEHTYSYNVYSTLSGTIKISQIVVPVRLIVTGVALYAGFTLDERVRAPSCLPTSLWLLRRLSDLLLRVQGRAARRPHRTLSLFDIVGRVDNSTRRRRWWQFVRYAWTCNIIPITLIL